MNVAQFFDTAYSGCDRYWWQGDLRYSVNPIDHRTSLLTQTLLRLIAHRQPGRALDLGAGEGADTIRLAKLGYDVDAVDISSVGADKVAKFASTEGVSHKVNAYTMDACDFIPKYAYDIVVGNGLLHYVRDKERLIRQMRSCTVKGGLNVLSLWSTYTPVPECHDVVPVYADEEDGIVAKIYRDWSIELMYLERDKLEAAHSDLPPHRHSHIKLIARNE